MLRFFRQIRQRLLPIAIGTDNKFSKYLLYAVGEILLVVIGILIALQIDNWNNERIEASREQTILKNLRVDFKNNISNVSAIYNRSLEAYQASVKLLEIIKDDNVVNPSEIELLVDDIINKIQSLDIITGSLDELFNTGSLHLISDPILRKQLSNWSFYYSDTEDDIVIYRDYLFSFFIPSLTEKVRLRNMSVPSFFEEELDLENISRSNFEPDYQNSIRTIEFENQVYNNTLNYMYVLNSYKVFQNYLEETLEIIEANIK
jgi:hypothetical protein